MNLKAMLTATAVALPLALYAGPSAASDQPQSAAAEEPNPWRASFLDVEPITVADPKAVAMLSVEEGAAPHFTIDMADIGLSFGYLIPAHVAGFEVTRLALQALYPDGVPERGAIRVAGPETNDIVLVASYLTGARDFYLVDDPGGGDLVIDETLGADRPGKYVMIFQRKDNGRTVEAVFDRAALVPDNQGGEDYGNTAAIYIDLLNDRTPEAAPEEQTRVLNGLMELIIGYDHEKLYSARVIDGYAFPTVGRVDPARAALEGTVAAWFAAAEALDAKAYAQQFAEDGRLTIGNGEPAEGRSFIEATAQGFFGAIEGLDHRVETVLASDTATVVKGEAIYSMPEGRTVELPMSVKVELDGDLIREAQVFIDPSPLAASADPM